MPQKKMTEQIKPWDRKTKTPYKVDRFSTNKSFLIVCEGQTEKEYFESFDLTNINIICLDCKGLSKLKLIGECKKKVEQFKKNGTRFSEIWCVFDMDVKRGESEFADFDNAIASGYSNNFKIAYSNDAFELWFYLHYNYTDQQHNRTFYYKKLSKYFGYNYEKFGKCLEKCKENYNRFILDSNAEQDKAIERAKKLHDALTSLPYSQQNPVTTVYLLVQNLNKYLRGTRRS